MKRNLSQNGFALQHARVSPGYMSELMNGLKSPSAAVRARIQTALRESDFDALFEIVEVGPEAER